MQLCPSDGGPTILDSLRSPPAPDPFCTSPPKRASVVDSTHPDSIRSSPQTGRQPTRQRFVRACSRSNTQAHVSRAESLADDPTHSPHWSCPRGDDGLNLQGEQSLRGEIGVEFDDDLVGGYVVGRLLRRVPPGPAKDLKSTKTRFPKGKMAGAAGLEPVTSAVTGQRSNQLSYAPAIGDSEGRKPTHPSQRRIPPLAN
jgi:hypothetical protein